MDRNPRPRPNRLRHARLSPHRRQHSPSGPVTRASIQILHHHPRTPHDHHLRFPHAALRPRTRALRYAICIDDNPPQLIDTLADPSHNAWQNSVSDNIRRCQSNHPFLSPGYHTIHLFMIDPALIIQRLVINLGDELPSYLGPPESFVKDANKQSRHVVICAAGKITQHRRLHPIDTECGAF